ncbi:ABC transporter [Pseudarthrobacter sp. J75]|uniref:ABC transporter n=1 Tax=unclassified Pseudarthrobacter TaxID=2647000 RepID=UPI002E7FE7DA|nr:MULTISPECIES: ABC transporter [unclassified Pseudarthrobacter]MEE2522482.1 ABC transporter [Pseudarthrobacter sp. J47]MEE2529187.1 ABC transporter [Pseudarthrobacter sp. J75]
MQTPKVLSLSVALLALALAGCSVPAGAGASNTGTPGSGTPDGGTTGDGHGTVAGASEVAEPQLHLLTIDPAGATTMLDLADESTKEAGTLAETDSISTDGRYIFASSADAGTLTILDSGTWTWDHEDHFHYYRSSSRLVGTVEGDGAAVVAPGSARTGVFFPETGEGMLLDNAGLAKGEVRRAVELAGEPHQGMVVPLGDFALATVPGTDGTASGTAGSVQVHDGSGAAVPGAVQACPDARGTITTAVGVVIGCADGAVLATVTDGAVGFEHIPYPEGAVTGPAAEARASVFRAREGRPTVAAVAGTEGAWLLNTRKRAWQLIRTDVPLLQVSAVDDKKGHVVALSADGRVLVLSAETGETLSTTEPLLPETVADPELLAGVELVTDQQRAYLNAPAEQKLYEIDFADGGRLARTFPTPAAPQFFTVTGR